MFKTLANAWRIPELRKKLMFTMLVLLVYRLVSAIPVPYINIEALKYAFEQGNFGETILGLYNVMSGSGLSQASVLALGIQPYINASIIIQLLCVAIPALERMAKEEGEIGKKKIERITRYSTVGLGVMLGFAYYVICKNQGFLTTSANSILPAVVIVAAFAAGSSLVMWMGEQITEFGIGNGISMILFANIISGLPTALANMLGMSWWVATIVVVGMAVLVVFIVFINDAERRIPIQYAKRVVGRKVYGGQNTNLPIKVAMSGVMPVIFAQSICTIPATIFSFYFASKGIQANAVTGLYGNFWYDYIFSPNSWTYLGFYVLMIFFFSWFYSTIQYDPVEISNNLKNNGGFIPGFRPGRPTSEFIQKVINKIIVFGAIYLAVVAGLPLVASAIANMPAVRTGAFSAVKNLSIGGTSVIIVVGVALETVKALEAQMLMRHYKGFLD